MVVVLRNVRARELDRDGWRCCEMLKGHVGALAAWTFATVEDPSRCDMHGGIWTCDLRHVDRDMHWQPLAGGRRGVVLSEV